MKGSLLIMFFVSIAIAGYLYKKSSTPTAPIKIQAAPETIKESLDASMKMGEDRLKRVDGE
ncbi:MAG: hypothetical protein CME71_02120 [Halobacteriovorax sp.]|nr:hypothetical protein [Halobacteriovorax sp.]